MDQILMKLKCGVQTAAQYSSATPFKDFKKTLKSYLDRYLFKLLKILGIQLIFNLGNKCSFHIVYVIPFNSVEPRMYLNKQIINPFLINLSKSKNMP